MKKLRKMKKIFVFMFALMLVLGMSAVAFAKSDKDQRADQASIIIDKDFKLLNEESISPAEKFDFTITKEGVAHSQYTIDDMPMFNPTKFKISFEQGEANANTTGDTNSYTLQLPTYNKVGVFTYKIEEISKSTAGLIYDTRDLILTVYVENAPGGEFIRYATLHDGASTDKMDKVSGFHNDFESGNLAVIKNVTGSMGDQLREFNIAVTLNVPDGKTITAPVKYSGGKYIDESFDFIDGEAILNLQIRHNDTITFSNLPYGTAWEVAETDYTGEGYTTTIKEEEGTIGAASFTSTITNHKDANIDTGINLDNLPYIMIIVVAVGGLVGFTLRRRFTNNK